MNHPPAVLASLCWWQGKPRWVTPLCSEAEIGWGGSHPHCSHMANCTVKRFWVYLKPNIFPIVSSGTAGWATWSGGWFGHLASIQLLLLWATGRMSIWSSSKSAQPPEQEPCRWWSCRGVEGPFLTATEERDSQGEERSKELISMEVTVAADPNPSAGTTRKGFA